MPDKDTGPLISLVLVALAGAGVGAVACGSTLVSALRAADSTPLESPTGSLLEVGTAAVFVAVFSLVLLTQALLRLRHRSPASDPTPEPTLDEGNPARSAGRPPEPSPSPVLPDGLPDANLSNEPWTKLVEECVGLFDELVDLQPTLDESRGDMARHVAARLEEILDVAGVQVIVSEQTFDWRRHQPEPANAAIATGAHIAETLTPGFAVGKRIFRRAHVRVNSNYGGGQHTS